MGANVKREEPGYRNYIGKVKGKVEWSVREDKVRESDRQKPDDSRLRPRFDDTRPERYSPESRRKRSPSRERPARRSPSRERPERRETENRNTRCSPSSGRSKRKRSDSRHSQSHKRRSPSPKKVGPRTPPPLPLTSLPQIPGDAGGAPIIIIPSAGLGSGQLPPDILASLSQMIPAASFQNPGFQLATMPGLEQFQDGSFQANTPPGFSFAQVGPGGMFQLPVPAGPITPPLSDSSPPLQTRRH